MIAFPPAKINIGLQITNKRADGFHNISTYFHIIPLYDIIEIVENKKSTKLYLSGLSIDGTLEDNLCLKAYNLLSSNYNLPPVSIYLHKNIPIQSGLGGASSDASSVLKLLNEMFNLSLSNSILKRYAEQLGSDCPFFIDSTPALAKEKGQLLKPLELSHKLPPHLVVLMPYVHISTAKAYSHIKPNPNANELSELLQAPIKTWRNTIHNDFESYLFHKHPETANIKQALYNAGAIYASLSGSGSAFYAFFKHKPKDNAFDNLAAKRIL